MTSAQDSPFCCLVDSRNKPLPDSSFDRIIALHAEIDDPVPFLKDAWRVLKGEGSLLIVLPKMNSAWAKCPSTPFGKEPAFSAAQIKRALIDQGFMPPRVRFALLARPDEASELFSLASLIEKQVPSPLFGFASGALVVEAKKRICGFSGSKAKKNQEHCADSLYPSPLPI